MWAAYLLTSTNPLPDMPTAAPRCQPDRIIKASPRWEITRHQDGDTADIIDTIMYADKRSAGFVLPGVQCLQADTEYKTLRNVWAFIKYNLKYRADKRGHERIKSPGALFDSGVGDCKSYSIATGAILRALGIPYRYRFAAYDRGEYSHVYVVADGVDGDVVLDSVYEHFDAEHPYNHIKDIRPATSPAVNGIGAATVDFTGFTIGALLAWVFLKNW